MNRVKNFLSRWWMLIVFISIPVIVVISGILSGGDLFNPDSSLHKIVGIAGITILALLPTYGVYADWKIGSHNRLPMIVFAAIMWLLVIVLIGGSL